MKFYCWKANGDENQVDNQSHEAASPEEAAKHEASFKAYFSPLSQQNIWVMWLSPRRGHEQGGEEQIALVSVIYTLSANPTSPTSYSAVIVAAAKLRWIKDEAAWRKEMSR